MTTIRKLAELFRALAAEDIGGATSIAAELCKEEEEKGHRTAARMLRGALTASRKGALVRETHVHEGQHILSTGLVRLKDSRSLEQVTLKPAVRAELESVIAEWRHATALRKHGIAPRSKLLFHGPPGCGKSLTAQALGKELGLPVYMVRFDAVIGAFLGQTAMHLRQLFHFAETTPCVLLLDELDALGKRRGNPLDVGELDRIVISLLQELEHSSPMGIVIGTTNLPNHLDDALWRRFDLDILFASPTQTTLRNFVGRLGKDSKVTLRPEVIAQAVKSQSFAAAERAVVGEIRRLILDPLRRE